MLLKFGAKIVKGKCRAKLKTQFSSQAMPNRILFSREQRLEKVRAEPN